MYAFYLLVAMDMLYHPKCTRYVIDNRHHETPGFLIRPYNALAI